MHVSVCVCVCVCECECAYVFVCLSPVVAATHLLIEEECISVAEQRGQHTSLIVHLELNMNAL